MPDIADVAWSEHDERNSEAVPNGWPTGAFPAYTDQVGQMMMGATKRFWNKINPVYQTSGTGDNYVVQTEIGIDQINLYEILCIRIDRSNTTTTPTLQFGATNARTIVKAGPSGYVPLAAGDMYAGNSHTFWYNGAFYVLTDPAISNLQPLSPNLTSWAAITRAAGFDTWVATPTSANLAALVGDETGTGALVFGTGPTLSAPLLAGGTSGTTILQASANASGTLTLPAATDTLVGRATTDTLTNKTINGANNTITNVSLTTGITGTLPIGNGGTNATNVGGARLNLTVPVYVSSLSALQALDTTKDIVACVTGSGAQSFYNWTGGNFSTQITAADPRYVASNANPTGSSGAWIQRGSVETGQFFQPSGAMVHYLADRVLMGSAVNNKANAVSSQADWLTTYQIGTGRSFGFIEFSQASVLNGNGGSNSANAFTAGAQSANFTSAGNAIGTIAVGVSNNSSFSTNAYAFYAEAYRASGSAGGAYGLEIDTVNYNALAATNPFAQASGQTIGLQLAAGAGLSAVGQFAASAAINIWSNNAVFDKGISFGFTAINGTNGTDGNTGEAIAMATGHAITYYYGNNTKSWTLKAKIGVNGDYTFTTAGTGAVSVPKIVAGSGLLTSTASATITGNAAALQAPTAGTLLHVGNADGTSPRVLVDGYGAAGPPLVTFRAARNTAASPSALQAGDNIVTFGGLGYGATAYGGDRVKFLAVASENWTDTAQGTQIALQVTPVGSTTIATAVTIGNDKKITGAGGVVSTHATQGVGYATGAGGTVTQATSRTTGVTLNTVSGAITMFTAAASATPATFTVTNSAVAATDTISLNVSSGANASNAYIFTISAVAAGSFNVTFWSASGTNSDTPVLHFNVIKGVSA